LHVDATHALESAFETAQPEVEPQIVVFNNAQTSFVQVEPVHMHPTTDPHEVWLTPPQESDEHCGAMSSFQTHPAFVLHVVDESKTQEAVEQLKVVEFHSQFDPPSCKQSLWSEYPQSLARQTPSEPMAH